MALDQGQALGGKFLLNKIEQLTGQRRQARPRGPEESADGWGPAPRKVSLAPFPPFFPTKLHRAIRPMGVGFDGLLFSHEEFEPAARSSYRTISTAWAAKRSSSFLEARL